MPLNGAKVDDLVVAGGAPAPTSATPRMSEGAVNVFEYVQQLPEEAGGLSVSNRFGYADHTDCLRGPYRASSPGAPDHTPYEGYRSLPGAGAWLHDGLVPAIISTGCVLTATTKPK
jgi:hypothetical protein